MSIENPQFSLSVLPNCSFYSILIFLHLNDKNWYVQIKNVEYKESL